MPSIFGVENPLVPRSTRKPRMRAVELRPHDGDVGDRRIGDPGLGAGQPIAARHLLGARHHRAGIGAVVGLGQPEAAEQFAGRHLRQIFAALRLGAVGIDRLHGERGLHRHRRAETGIDALELARDQPVTDIAETGAAVFLRDGRAQQSELAHLAEDRRIGLAVAIGGEDARKQLLLRIIARGIAHHALFFGQLAFEIERIVPFERGVLDQRAFRHRCSASGFRSFPQAVTSVAPCSA